MAQHSHASASSGSGHRTRLAAAFLITAGIVVAQLVGAWVAGSLALLTDAVHSFTDTIGLGVALIAATLMFRAATATRTWGFRRVEILAGFLQAALLLGVGVYAAVEGIGRLSDPPEVAHVELMIFGILGLVGNIASMAVLNASRKDNFNVRAAFLEVTADALGSLGVVVAAAVIWTTGWQQADAAAALVIAALIIPRALKLMVETARILLEFAPKGLTLRRSASTCCSWSTSRRSTTCTPPQWPPGCRSSPPMWWSTIPASARAVPRTSWPSCRPVWPSILRSPSSTPPSSWKPATSPPPRLIRTLNRG